MSDQPWHDPAWAAAVLGAATGTPLAGRTVDGPVLLVVPPTAGRPRRGAPAGDDVRGHLLVEQGRVTGGGAGEPDGTPVLTLTLPAPDLAELLAGTEPSVLFMQGRLKVDGDLGTALALLAATADPAFAAGLAAVADA